MLFRSEGAVDRERQRVGGLDRQGVVQTGESNEAIEKMVAVGAAADDVKEKIDLGGCGDADHAYGSPASSFFLSCGTDSGSGSRRNARSHWKRASARRPIFQ